MTLLFTDFEKRVSEVDERRQAAQLQENELKKMIAKQEIELDTANITGTPSKELRESMAANLKELERTQRILLSFSKSPSLISSILTNEKSISSLAVSIMENNLTAISEGQRDYDTKAKALQEIKAEFLKIVGEMGILKRDAETLSGEINKCRKYVPGKEKIFYSGIIENFNELHCQGSIFIQLKESLQAYQSH